MRHADRLDALAGRIDRPLLVTNLVNIRYLTGFTGSSAYLLVDPGGAAVFLTDGRYGEAAEALVSELPGTSLRVSTSGMWDPLVDALSSVGEISLEAGHVTWDFVRTLGDRSAAEAVPTQGIVEDLRRTKDDDELEALRRAAAAGDAAFAKLAALVGESSTEADLGWALTDEMRRHGGDPADWEPIVAAGAGASVPHYRSGGMPIGDGLLLLDYGCVVGGYHSDMSRTVWLSGAPDPEMEAVYEAVADAHRAAIDAIGPDVACGDVDAAARSALAGRGLAKHFLHSTGHGVGLEIHEAPWVRRDNEDLLRVGDVVTVEPGVYLPGVGGVRIEDMVLVGAEGPVVLTKSSREFALR